MVICYSPEELNSIGEMVFLQQCINRMQQEQEQQCHLQKLKQQLLLNNSYAHNSYSHHHHHQQQQLHYHNDPYHHQQQQGTYYPYNQPNSAPFNFSEFLQFQHHLKQQLGDQIQISYREPSPVVDSTTGGAGLGSGAITPLFAPNGEPLTAPVAEFFQKAQKNFHVHMSIDPTRIRRLSEVEAELMSDSRDSC